MFGIRKPMFDDIRIAFETMGDADNTYNWMCNEINKNSQVSTKKLFDKLEMPGNNVCSYHLGWKTMRNIHIESTDDGYAILCLPYPKKIRPNKEDI